MKRRQGAGHHYIYQDNITLSCIHPHTFPSLSFHCGCYFDMLDHLDVFSMHYRTFFRYALCHTTGHLSGTRAGINRVLWLS